MYLLTTVVFVTMMLGWKFDIHNIVREKAIDKWNKFRSVNKLVESRYKSYRMIIWISIQMIAKMYWMNFLQWANNTIHYPNKNNVEISYVVRGRLYKMTTKIHRGAPSVILITDHNNEDVTDLVLPFYGVGEDWHKNSFTPSYWGRNSLTFELGNGESKTFSLNDPIVI